MDHHLPKNLELLDGDALGRQLTALAKRAGDQAVLRKEGLALIKEAFLGARGRVKQKVEDENLSGLAAARALSAIQDTVIRVIHDFAVHQIYPLKKNQVAEQITIVATGGYGRGELAPGSDIDLLFLRAAKQTSWGESVIEFVLYMLWDLGQEVGHATRSLVECVKTRQAGHHNPHRLARGALSVGQ